MSVTTATLPDEFARHWVKRLARAMGVPIETARHWAFRRIPDARRKEIAHALIAECDRLAVVISETRKQWAEVAGDDGTSSETGRRGSVEGEAAAVARGPTNRDGTSPRRVVK